MIDFRLSLLFRDCPIGYNKNEESGKCDGNQIGSVNKFIFYILLMHLFNSLDIDECEERIDVTCNIENQVCLNTPGSYQCLEITRVSNTCPNGFKFDQKIKQCIGNEH